MTSSLSLLSAGGGTRGLLRFFPTSVILCFHRKSGVVAFLTSFSVEKATVETMPCEDLRTTCSRLGMLTRQSPSLLTHLSHFAISREAAYRQFPHIVLVMDFYFLLLCQ